MKRNKKRRAVNAGRHSYEVSCTQAGAEKEKKEKKPHRERTRGGRQKEREESHNSECNHGRKTEK